MGVPARASSHDDPTCSPNANACGGRLALTAEVNDQMLISGERHLQLILAEYLALTTDSGPTAADNSGYPSPVALPPTSP
jgi:hypothetical protein